MSVSVPQANFKKSLRPQGGYNSESSLNGIRQEKALGSVDLLILFLNVLGNFLQNLGAEHTDVSFFKSALTSTSHTKSVSVPSLQIQ